MASSSGRIDREKRTVAAMTRLTCRGLAKRGTGNTLCEPCRALHEYATLRLPLGKCPFGDEKSACSKCPAAWPLLEAWYA